MVAREKAWCQILCSMECGCNVVAKFWSLKKCLLIAKINRWEAAREISKKRNFFVNRSIPENFQWENFLGQVPTESLRTQDSENVYEKWIQQIFDPVLVARSWVSATKWGPLAKLWTVKKNKHGHNFQDIGSKMNQRLVIVYDPTLIRFGSNILKIVAYLLFWTLQMRSFFLK